MNDESLSLISRGLSETRRLGVLLGQLLGGGEVVCLEGELGTGKTSLIQGIGRGMGIEEPITSPTFTLVNEYEGRKARLYHVDLYRLENTDEMIAAGIDGYLYSHGVCVIEWAEKARDMLPSECLFITLKHVSEKERDLLLQARGQAYHRLLHRLKTMLGLDDERQRAGN